MTQAQLHAALAEAAEAEYAAFSSKLLGGAQKPLLGVRLPALRRLAAQLVRENGEAALSLCMRGQYFEDVMLKGMVLGRLPAPLNTVLAETRAFLGEIDNWSVCDSFCAGYLHAKRHPGEIFAFAKAYLSDRREFAARFGIVLLMDHFRGTPYAAQALGAMPKWTRPGAIMCRWALPGRWPPFTWNFRMRCFIFWPPTRTAPCAAWRCASCANRGACPPWQKRRRNKL